MTKFMTVIVLVLTLVCAGEASAHGPRRGFWPGFIVGAIVQGAVNSIPPPVVYTPRSYYGSGWENNSGGWDNGCSRFSCSSTDIACQQAQGACEGRRRALEERARDAYRGAEDNEYCRYSGRCQ